MISSKKHTCQILERWIDHVLSKGCRTRTRGYKTLRSFCDNSIPKAWYLSHVNEARELLQTLGSDEESKIVYEYLDPIVYHYEHKPNSERIV